MSSITSLKIDEQFDIAIKSVIHAFETKAVFYEKENSYLQQDLINKSIKLELLDNQLNKSNFENEQQNKLNENLIQENKLLMDEIISLKNILKKTDEWKIRLFDYILKQDQVEKKVLKSMLYDFPSYIEIKENFDSLKKNGRQIDRLTNLSRDFNFSSFNSHALKDEFDIKMNKNRHDEIYYSEKLENYYIREKNKINSDSETSPHGRKNKEIHFNLEAHENSSKRPIKLNSYKNEDQRNSYEEDNRNNFCKSNEKLNNKEEINKKVQFKMNNFKENSSKNMKNNEFTNVNDPKEKANIKSYDYSPKLKSFAHSTRNLSPKSDNNLNFYYKNQLFKGKNSITEHNNKSFEAELKNKSNRFRNLSKNLDNLKDKNFDNLENKTIDTNRNHDKRTNQYLLSSKFFAECRNNIKKNEYDFLINTLKSFNKREITQNEAFERIGKVLESYEKLFREFKNLFLK